jgi:hypothetical protein
LYITTENSLIRFYYNDSSGVWLPQSILKKVITKIILKQKSNIHILSVKCAYFSGKGPF